MNRFTRLLSALVLILALCVGTATAETAGLSSNAVLEVNIWDNNQLAGLRKIADEWSAKTGVKVNLNVITWTEYWTLLEAGASGGKMPDVF